MSKSMPAAALAGITGGGDIENSYGSTEYDALKKNDLQSAPWGEELSLNAPVCKPTGALVEAWDRGRWLVGLMLMQSTSSWILGKYTALLEEHMVIISFLTMLVGAGGNAGAQAAVASVRGIALCRPEYSAVHRVLPDALVLALLLSAALGCIAWIRVSWVYGGDFYDACALSLSCVLIVVSSVVLGATLPFLIKRLGFDPAHAGATIQVIYLFPFPKLLSHAYACCDHWFAQIYPNILSNCRL
eukprot:SAG31_NODE_5575_length_2448_cov_1.476799_3_plen_244_part_00